jgi:uncharacterized SAM-binding protein YcdF (DUF218 family)
LGLAFVLVTLTPVDRWWALWLAGPRDDPAGDVLIVLTGSGLEDGIIGLSSYWRAVYALRILKADAGFREAILTGGGPDPVPLAVTMREFLVAQGIAGERLRVETAAASTHDSAVNVAALLRQDPERYRGRRLVLMTSDYHMYRSHRAFARVGVVVEPRPVPDVLKRYSGWADRWGLFLELGQEQAKIVYYWARGWI